MTPAHDATSPLGQQLLVLGEDPALAISIAVMLAGAGRSLASHELAGALSAALRRVDLVLLALRRSGVILSQRGRHGGYVLAREASAVTLLEIVEATRLIALARPPSARRPPQTHVLDTVDDTVRGWLARTALAELLTRPAGATS